jgi:hypothetical protein
MTTNEILKKAYDDNYQMYKEDKSTLQVCAVARAVLLATGYHLSVPLDYPIGTVDNLFRVMERENESESKLSYPPGA